MIAMESTGTYGDALRQALTDAKLTVHRVSGKAVHDYAEIFDGVPSQHDGKDAAMVAELAAMGKSSPWPYQSPTEFDQELRYWVERMDIQQRIEMLWLGRLEALLARHWPEATRYLELNSETLLQILAEYGGPAALVADADAAKRLKGWGGLFLKSEKIERFVQVSASSVGVRQTAVDRRRMRSVPKRHCRPSMKFRRRRADVGEAGPKPCDHRPSSGGRGMGDGLRALGISGRSGGLSLCRSVSQGDGTEPQGT